MKTQNHLLKGASQCLAASSRELCQVNQTDPIKRALSGIEEASSLIADAIASETKKKREAASQSNSQEPTKVPTPPPSEGGDGIRSI